MTQYMMMVIIMKNTVHGNSDHYSFSPLQKNTWDYLPDFATILLGPLNTLLIALQDNPHDKFVL